MGGGGVWFTASEQLQCLSYLILQVWGDLAELLRHSLLPLLRKGRTKIMLY